MNVVLIATACVAAALVGRVVYARHPSGARLAEALREVELQRRRLATVSAAQRGIFADGVDSERVLLSVATWASAIVDCDAAIIAMPDGDELVVRSAVGGDASLIGLRVAISGSPTGRCLLTNAPVVWSGATTGDRARPEMLGQLNVGSLLAVPLLSADRSIPAGVLHVQSSRHDAFDDDDIAALTVVSQIARKALTESTVLAALQSTEARYRALVDHLPESAVMVYDRDLRLEMVAGPGSRTWRYAERNVVPGLLLEEIVSPAELAILRPHYQSALDGVGSSLEYKSVIGLDLKIDAAPMVDDGGYINHALIVVTDVTRRRVEEAALRIAEQRYRTAFDFAPVGMAQLTPTGEFEAVNRAFCELIGYTADQLCGTSFTTVTRASAHGPILERLQSMLEGDQGTWSSEGRFIHSTGRVVWVMQSTTLIRDLDGTPRHFLSHYVDITDRKQFDSKLKHLSEHDPLTGLQNRRSFELELDRLAASIVRNGPGGALLVLDLDHFKHVNDTLGHGAGDDLIVSLADVLRRRLRSTDVIARLGGDEFAVLLANTTAEQAQRVAGGLVDAIRDEVTLLSDAIPRTVTTSIGIGLFDRPGLDAAEVLINADLTMFEAKAAGGDRFALYQPRDTPQPRGKTRRNWVDRITSALDENRFTLYAQPILDLTTRQVTRFELLLRMIGDDGELIPPADFLGIAENVGLIVRIDRWVVDRAIAVLAAHDDASLRFEVNLSGLSIGDSELLAFIEQRLHESPAVDPSQLIFEVTETVAVANIELARVFAERLSALGCSFALDDFGAGYGSFYYLKHLPCDDLKIDGEFVANCLHNSTDRLVIDAIVGVARGLGKRTIAEFVGDDATIEFLREHGVDLAQGYHIGRPIPLDDAILARTAPVGV